MSVPRKKLIVLIVLTLVTVTSATWAGYWLWLRTEPPMPQTYDQVASLVQDARFRQMPLERKVPYLEKIQAIRQEMTPEQHAQARDLFRNEPELREAMGEVGRDMMYQRVLDYSRADPAQRQAMLQEMIDRERAARQMGGGGPPRPPRDASRSTPRTADASPRQRPSGERTAETDQQRQQRHENRRRDMKTRIQRRIERGQPQRQALMAEFFKALREEREKQGLPPMGSRGPRGR